MQLSLHLTLGSASTDVSKEVARRSATLFDELIYRTAALHSSDCVTPTTRTFVVPELRLTKPCQVWAIVTLVLSNEDVRVNA